MVDRALTNPKIKVRWNSAVKEIVGSDGKVGGVRVVDTQTGEESELDVTGVFVAIGHHPRSELFRGQVDLDANGYVLVQHPSSRTNLPGVYAAGDVAGFDGKITLITVGFSEAALAANHAVARIRGEKAQPKYSTE
jgi:thioredoxin reductase (NADPH)